MHSYPRHIGDYQSHTRHLSLQEHGAYGLMLDLYYLHEKPLKGDAATIARFIGAPGAARAVETVLTEFFVQRSNRWHNKRADEEIVKNLRRLANCSKGGQTAAQKNGSALVVHSDCTGSGGGSENTAAVGSDGECVPPPPEGTPLTSLPNLNHQRSESEGGGSDEGQGGQGRPDGEALGRILIAETKILDRSDKREVILLAAGVAAAAKGLTEAALRRLIAIGAGKAKPGGWVRWVLEGNRWDAELKLADGAP